MHKKKPLQLVDGTKWALHVRPKEFSYGLKPLRTQRPLRARDEPVLAVDIGKSDQAASRANEGVIETVEELPEENAAHTWHKLPVGLCEREAPPLWAGIRTRMVECQTCAVDRWHDAPERSKVGACATREQGELAAEQNLMNLVEQLEAVERLGKEFSARGWSARLGDLRAFYAALMAGESTTERWNEQHLLWWLRVLQLAPESMPKLPSSSRCPKCSGADGAVKRTRAALEDRYVFMCDCGADWVELA